MDLIARLILRLATLFHMPVERSDLRPVRVPARNSRHRSAPPR
ncbi:hypothetical protein [Bosea sp. BK604]|nr:hypothetical protein [Bosea sp. BK604]TCR67248.1 hypothetical protein EV560_103305 [Bosea sp. BK604]